MESSGTYSLVWSLSGLVIKIRSRCACPQSTAFHCWAPINTLCPLKADFGRRGCCFLVPTGPFLHSSPAPGGFALVLRISKALHGSVTVKTKSPSLVVCDLAGEHVMGSPEVHSWSSEKSTISVDLPLGLALQLWVHGISIPRSGLSRLRHLLAVWSWACCLTPLCLHFLDYKATISSPTFQGVWGLNNL